MSHIHKRGFHLISGKKENPLYTSLKDDNALGQLVALVKNNDNLTLEIRDNYLNIYYEGGSIAKITSSKSVDLNKNYFRVCKNKRDEDWDKIDTEVKKAKSLLKAGKFQEYIDLVKTAMFNYWNNVLEGKGVDEKKSQHQICLCNSYGYSDYTQLDVEYEVSKKSTFKYSGLRRTSKEELPSPRFDIIAIRNCDHRLCIIELKKGTGALADKSGVQEHAESYHNTVGLNEKTQKDFLNEMQNIVVIKQSLGLLPEDVYIDLNLSLEYLFAYQYSSKDELHPSKENQMNTFLHYQNKTTYKLDKVNHAEGMKVLWLEENDFTLRDKV